MSMDDGNIHDLMSSGNKRPGLITPHDGSLPKSRIHYGMGETIPSALRVGSLEDDDDESNEEVVWMGNILTSPHHSFLTFSPFGLFCQDPRCADKPYINLDERAVKGHLDKKHPAECDSNMTTVV